MEASFGGSAKRFKPAAPAAGMMVRPQKRGYDEGPGQDQQQQDPVAQDMQMMSKSGYSSGGGGGGGTGSAWEGQMQSLQTDAFLKGQFQDVRNDVHTSLTTSAHIMNQGGVICQDWVQIDGPFKKTYGGGDIPGDKTSLLNLSMGHVTGNTMSGMANIFNQYYLCKLKKLTIIFKDIVVATEASTNVGLHFMADVITEWRRRPTFIYNGTRDNSVVPFANNDAPDWWQDWRPATDGAVEFSFDVESNEIPTFVANAILAPATGQITNAQMKNPDNYRTFGQYIYGNPNGSVWQTSATTEPWRFQSISSGTFTPYSAVGSHNWLDYVFEWRARNCPNSESGVATSAAYNIQINALWDLSYRQTAINPGTFPAVPPP